MTHTSKECRAADTTPSRTHQNLHPLFKNVRHGTLDKSCFGDCTSQCGMAPHVLLSKEICTVDLLNNKTIHLKDYHNNLLATFWG